MPRVPPVPPLAKLSRPKIHRALKRERLFDRMDQSAQGTVTWLVSPPGAGKTTLLATYLDSRKLPGIWYQLDRDDGEAATFFYYMSEAEKRLRAGARRRPLPLLTPEYLQDMEGFSRRYFRDLFARLGARSVLVLDNFQDAPEESALIALLMQGLLEVPEDVHVFIASRTPPPAGASRLAANGALSILDWDDIRLTPDESAEIARAQMPVDAEQLGMLHEKSGGWAVGLVLLVERLRRGETLEQLGRTDALQGVFAYFAEEMFRHSSEEHQRVMMQLAYMPRFTGVEAVNLTGNESSLQMLDTQYRRRLFLDRREGKEVTYQFHALLQAFLRHQAASTMSTSVRAGVARRAAQLLEASDQIEEAMRLYLDMQDHAAARVLILRHAQSFIAQGRWQVVVDWLVGLPPESVEQDRWLLYWRGSARLAVDPVAARADLERAHEHSRDAGDDVCELLAAAGMVHAHMLEYVAYRPLDRWIAVLQKMLDSPPTFPSLEAELNVLSALLAALAYRQPSHPRIHEVVERLFELVGTGADVGARHSAALYLTLYGGVSGPSAVSERAAPILRALVEHPDLSALTRAFGWFVLSFYYKLAYMGKECDQALDQVRLVADEYGLPFVHRFAAIIGAWQDLGRLDFASAGKKIERLRELVEPTNLYDMASLHWLRGQSAIMQLRADEALAEARKAVEIFDAAGAHFHRVTARNILVWAHLYRGEFDEARHWIRDARQIAGAVFHSYTAQIYHAADAWMALEEDNAEALVQGLRGLFGPATQDYPSFMFKLWSPVVPRLAAAALERGVETHAVRRVVRGLDCRAPYNTLEEWPWRVRVYTLGRFQVYAGDEQITFGSKVPRKPLSLLKALICAGGSSRDYHLIDALWPNEEAGAARSAFGVALFRLRAMLGDHDGVESKGGIVSLNRDLVWVDALAFDQLSQSPEAKLVNRALELYRGALLPEDADESWSFSLRERLRGKFSYHLGRQGRALEEAQSWEQAGALYLRGIDADSLTESFYLGMMRCHAAQGQVTEGSAVYRRLCHMLAASRGAKPSADAEALMRQLDGIN